MSIILMSKIGPMAKILLNSSVLLYVLERTIFVKNSQEILNINFINII